ncbi:hypothetical protein [Streptosporangium amethystogenes]
MESLGWSFQVPVHRAVQRDDEEISSRRRRCCPP